MGVLYISRANRLEYDYSARKSPENVEPQIFGRASFRERVSV